MFAFYHVQRTSYYVNLFKRIKHDHVFLKPAPHVR